MFWMFLGKGCNVLLHDILLRTAIIIREKNTVYSPLARFMGSVALVVYSPLARFMGSVALVFKICIPHTAAKHANCTVVLQFEYQVVRCNMRHGKCFQNCTEIRCVRVIRVASYVNKCRRRRHGKEKRNAEEAH
jgi:hypothetical protein